MRPHTTPRRQFAGLPDVPATRVVIVDDLLGTRREFTLPVEPEEAVRASADLELANYFCDRLTLFGDGENMSLGIAMRISKTAVLVRWFAVDGDVDRALAEREHENDELWGGVR